MSTAFEDFRPVDTLADAPESSPTNDDQLIELWVHERSPHTQRAYRADVARLRAWAAKPLRAVTLADLQAFAKTLTEGADATRYRALSAVKSLLAFGHRIGCLPLDVGRALRLPSVRNRLSERILSEADLHRILSLESNPRNRAMLTLLYASGIRVSELCTLAWRDLVESTGEGGQITVFGKGSVTRSIQLPTPVWQLVIAIRPKNAVAADPVFRSRKWGGFLQPVAVRRIVRAATARAGIALPVSPHWFRHAHASHALDRGAPIHLVQATLGHATVTTTGRYLHARPQESSALYLSF